VTELEPTSDKAPLNPLDQEDSAVPAPFAVCRRRRVAWAFAAAALALLLLAQGLARDPVARPSPTVRISATVIPTYPLAGGGEIPALLMGGNDFGEWFAAAGPGAGLQTFYAYGNQRHIAGQVAAYGRQNVFVSTGIPCGCCGADSPRIEPMNASLALGYVMEDLAQLNTSHIDLLLFHHRCRTPDETASVWKGFEAAKNRGLARHIGVSNFNAHDLTLLLQTAVEPIDVLEAHFGVGLMDWETLALARAHGIQPVAFSTLSEAFTDHPTLTPVVDAIAASHGVSRYQAMMAYVRMRNVTVLSSCFSAPARCAAHYADDLAMLRVTLTSAEMSALDALTLGKRTCTDCFTDECQACAHALHALGCDIGHNGMGITFPVWGRSNRNGTGCMACAERPQHRAAVHAACGGTARGESLETMVPKACGM